VSNQIWVGVQLKFAKGIQINAEISSETAAISIKITKKGKLQKYIEKNIGLDTIE
jgi:hypothetical protein